MSNMPSTDYAIWVAEGPPRRGGNGWWDNRPTPSDAPFNVHSHSVSLASTDIGWMESRIAWNGDGMVDQWDVVIGRVEDRSPYFWIDRRLTIDWI